MKEKYDDISEMLHDYSEEHKCCPKCGSKTIFATLVGFIANCNMPNEYVDRNRATCSSCGWKGRVHDLLPN